MSDTVIKIENLSKRYRLGVVGSRTFKEDLQRFWWKLLGKGDPLAKVGEENILNQQSKSNYIWALKDINLEVKRGEVLGIIGKNGAGKTTLLKILSRITTPTTGVVKIKGRLGSLLEVGTGFHPELTGRENIYLNGAILGMSKKEIDRKFDDIVDFAGVAKYIDTPVKRYSSGMYVRLGFAVAAFLEPDILVVDEVLAVGDAEFQKRAIGKMQEVSRGEGRTVLFVSHNMGSIQALCTRAILLDKGRIVKNSTIVSEVIKLYLKQLEDTISNTGKIDFSKNHIGDENIKLLEVFVTDGQRIKKIFSPDENIFVNIKFEVLNKISGLRFNVIVKNLTGIIIFVSSSHFLTNSTLDKGVYLLQSVIPPNLLNLKSYIIAINAGIPGIKKIIEPLDCLQIDISGVSAHGSYFTEDWPGLIAPRLNWKMYKL